MNRIALLVVKLLLLALLAVVLAWTNDLFFIVGSSASVSHMAAPGMPVQIGAFLVCATALLAPARGGRHMALFGVAVAAALLGGHRLLVDNLHDRISDVYLAVPVQVLSFDQEHEAGLSMQRVFGGIVIGPAGGNKSLRIISPPMIGLDKNQLAALMPSSH
jgi:hypothetical protein